MSSDRNLLFGVLALQMDFVSRDGLIAAMQAWLSEKEKPLGEILRERGNLTPARLRMLNQLVNEHVELHQGDVQQSLAAVSASSWLKQQLKSLCDPELQAALVSLGTARQEIDPYATPSYLPAPSDGVRYRVLRPHAKGGLGEVFVAEDTELHREVALKEIQNGTRTIQIAAAGSCSRRRSPAAWNIRASYRSMAWASMPTAGLITPCASSAATA